MRLVTLMLVGLTATAARAGDWQELFNGRDLTGWRANVASESFTVKDGVLRVQAVGPTASHLFTAASDYKNFELEAVVRAEPDGNGGVFVHTTQKTRPGGKLYLADGYEIQLNSSDKDKKKTGSLYDVVDLAESPVDETQWFTLKIVVESPRIRVLVNGKEVVDYTEPPGVKRPPARAGRRLSPAGGAIALQAHDPESVWYFKSIRVKRLPDSPSEARP